MATEAYSGEQHESNAQAFWDALVAIEKMAEELSDALHPTVSRIDPFKLRAVALNIIAACEHALDGVDDFE